MVAATQDGRAETYKQLFGRDESGSPVLQGEPIYYPSLGDEFEFSGGPGPSVAFPMRSEESPETSDVQYRAFAKR